ncbi:Acireductone dioxygenase [Neoconidiobolus thromboides FSU 785]|nr:Acireductone dioxygenase [Neoconidiobolus thromboides FSU 785]
MHAYYYNSEVDIDNPSAEHKFAPNREVDLITLKEVGVEYYQLDEKKDLNQQVKEFADKREYKNHDVNISPANFGASYEEKLKIFFEEHIHEDEEIRLILEGSGYFDVRDKKDQWIRIALNPYDLIVLPAGIYHRFTPDSKNFTKAMRLFKDLPKWTPINRPADDNPYRQEYTQEFLV